MSYLKRGDGVTRIEHYIKFGNTLTNTKSREWQKGVIRNDQRKSSYNGIEDS